MLCKIDFGLKPVMEIIIGKNRKNTRVLIIYRNIAIYKNLWELLK